MESMRIKPECYAEIMHYVQTATGEVSGLGRVQKASDGTLVVTKVYLLEQENGATTTDIDADAVAKLQYETREDAGHLNFWWHSHVNMGVFWSGTDMDTIKEFGANGYLLASVFNKKEEVHSAYFQGATDFLPECFIDDLETKIDFLPTQAMVESWDNEFKTKCRVKTYAPLKSVGFNSADAMNEYFDANDRHAMGLDHDLDMARLRQQDTHVKDLPTLEFTGMATVEVVDELEQCFTENVRTGAAFSQIGTWEQFLWWDAYSVLYGREPISDAEVEEIYISCFEDINYFNKMCSYILQTGDTYAQGLIDRPDTAGEETANNKSIHTGQNTKPNGDTKGPVVANGKKNKRGNNKTKSRKNTKGARARSK